MYRWLLYDQRPLAFEEQNSIYPSSGSSSDSPDQSSPGSTDM